MFSLRKTGLALSLLTYLLLLSNSGHSAEAVTYDRIILNGTINNIDTRKNIIIVDDMGFLISKDLEVKSISGKEGTLSSLYRGKRIRMEVDLNGVDNVGGTVYKIQMLK